MWHRAGNVEVRKCFHITVQPAGSPKPIPG